MSYDDFIEMYETSCEVMKLNEEWNKKTEFRDVVVRRRLLPVLWIQMLLKHKRHRWAGVVEET